MSFLTDLFEGNWSNLGTDIEHAPSSLVAHPDELAETLGVGALIAAPFVLPEIGAAFGAGELGATEVGAGAADIGAGAAETGLAADLGIGDIATEAGLAGLDAASIAPGALEFFGAAPLEAGFGIAGAGLGPDLVAPISGPDFGEASFDLSAGTGLESDAVPGQTFAQTDAELFGGATGTAPTATAPATTVGTTPSGFAATDAELSGGITGTGAGPSGAGGGGFFGNVTSALGGALSNPWTKLALGAAPLALTLGMGQAGLPSSAQQLQGQAAALSAQGQADLAAARSGQLNAGQTAQIATMSQNLKNQWLQTLYNQGVTDPTKDSRWPQILAMIDQQVTTATAQLIQQNITNALQETGQASTALTAIANMQMQSDRDFTNNLIGATKALGFAAGSSAGGFKIVPS